MNGKSQGGPVPWRSKRVWVAGIAVAAAVHAAGLFLFQAIPETGRPAPMERESRVILVGPEHFGAENESLWEQAMLRDSEPLFLPTRWNNSQALPTPALTRRPADLFAPYPPRWSYAETDFGLREEVFQAPVRTAMETYRQWNDPVVSRFGRGEEVVPALPERQARVELVSLSGEVLRSVDVRVDDAPAALRQLWLPVEFSLQVDSVGVIGEPIMLRGSGLEPVDRFLRRAIRGELLSRGLPPPGYYRILAGP